MKYPTWLAALLACALLPMAIPAVEVESLKAGVFDPPREAPDFSVNGTDGTPLTLSRYRGKVVLMAFGYSSCPNVCPTTLAVLAQARRNLGCRASQVQVIYLTVDPERDSPERLGHFLAALRPNLRGAARAPRSKWRRCARAIGVSAGRSGGGDDYAVAHSSFVYLITRDGKLRALMPFGHQADDYVHDIAMLLN